VKISLKTDWLGWRVKDIAIFHPDGEPDRPRELRTRHNTCSRRSFLEKLLPALGLRGWIVGKIILKIRSADGLSVAPAEILVLIAEASSLAAQWACVRHSAEQATA